MSGRPHHDEDLNDLDDAPEPDSFEVEGIQAFNRLTTAVTNLQSRLADLELGLGRKAAQAEQAATRAVEAAQGARTATEHAEAAARAKARSAASWAVLGALAGVLVAGAAGYWQGRLDAREIGLAEGYRAAVDHNAAASWANTPTSQLALALDRAGSLSTLAQCSSQGWTAETIKGRRVCIVRPLKDGTIYGWTLP